MDNDKQKARASMRNFIIALILLLSANILMGVALTLLYKENVRTQIEQRMLDVANTAAYMLDGDSLKSLQAEDRDTEPYRQAMGILRAFQENIELDYIYAIRKAGTDSFVFTIDPDTEAPSVFGSPIQTTSALKIAATGTPAVDKTAHTDEWGRFYSAYSPVIDSSGNITEIIGVDFDADWYDEKLASHHATAVIITAVTFILGVILSFTIMSQNRKRFVAMLSSLARLDRETQRLDNTIMRSSIKKLDFLPEQENGVLKTLAAEEDRKEPVDNEYDEVNTSIESVYRKLHRYIEYIEQEVELDDVTGVRNKISYKETIKKLDAEIESGEANFSVAFFDINDLKRIYTHLGFERGEQMMFECAKILKAVFGRDYVYHITGDEFIVILNNTKDVDMQIYFLQFEKALAEYNKRSKRKHPLSVAKGFATYKKGSDQDYRAVFVRAKANADEDKAEYHRKKAEAEGKK